VVAEFVNITMTIGVT